jgi:hypothetical protein
LFPSLENATETPEASDIYDLLPHITKSYPDKYGKSETGVYRGRDQVGARILQPYTLAHERGHAKYIFKHIKEFKALIKEKADNWTGSTTDLQAKVEMVDVQSKFYLKYLIDSGKDADSAEIGQVQSRNNWKEIISPIKDHRRWKWE